MHDSAMRWPMAVVLVTLIVCVTIVFNRDSKPKHQAISAWKDEVKPEVRPFRVIEGRQE